MIYGSSDIARNVNKSEHTRGKTCQREENELTEAGDTDRLATLYIIYIKENQKINK